MISNIRHKSIDSKVASLPHDSNPVICFYFQKYKAKLVEWEDLKMPKTSISSACVSKSTQNRSSKIVETVYKIVATNTEKDKSPPCDNERALMVNTIKRNIDEYVVASEEAGLKVVTKFKRETVLALKSQMTLICGG